LTILAANMGLTVKEATQVNFRSYSIPEAGNEPALIAAASAAKQGVVTGPVKETMEFIYIMQTVSLLQ